MNDNGSQGSKWRFSIHSTIRQSPLKDRPSLRCIIDFTGQILPLQTHGKEKRLTFSVRGAAENSYYKFYRTTIQ